MHNSFTFIEWGLSLSSYLKSDEARTLPDEQMSKIAWVKEYEPALITYRHLMEICKKALDWVHRRGYYRGIAHEFAESMDCYYYSDQRCYNFYKKVEAFLAEQGAKMPDGQHYLGSSEIIESLFGKFKHMEDHHSNAGLTTLLLALPALAGKIEESVLYEAMNTVSTNNLKDWFLKNMGQTFLSKRRQDLQPYKEAHAIKEFEVGKIIDLEYSDILMEYIEQN